MLFHAPEFIVIMTAILLLFWRFPQQRLLILALANLVFYGAAGWGMLALFLGVATITYLCSKRFDDSRGRWFFTIALLVNLANLLFFKYSLFLLTNLEAALSISLIADWPWLTRLALPIGISFYTFQQIAYLVDTYRKRTDPAPSWLTFWAFVSFFGLVLAGPIMRGKDLLPQLRCLNMLTFREDNFKAGAILFLTGLFKKVVLADTVAIYADRFFAQGTGLSGAEVWIAAYLFAFQLYLDFSGYSDMALGIGRLFGIRLTRNFATPYLSANATEFWRRWHITLSSWIRDYIYIPLGGGRKGEARKYLNLLAAMGVSGLWHGAAWTFIIWGLFHGLLLVGHNLLLKLRKRWGISDSPRLLVKVVSVVGFFHLTCIGWVFFRVPDIKVAWQMVSNMLSPGMLGISFYLVPYLGLVALLYAAHLIENWLYENRCSVLAWWEQHIPIPFRAAAYTAVLLLAILFMQINQSSFIYFQF